MNVREQLTASHFRCPATQRYAARSADIMPGIFASRAERSGPPDARRQRHRCVRTAKLRAILEDDVHLAHQRLRTQAQEFPDATILQRSHAKFVLAQTRRYPSREPRTKFAVGVIEKPAVRVPAFPVSEFGSERDHEISPGRGAFSFPIVAGAFTPCFCRFLPFAEHAARNFPRNRSKPFSAPGEMAFTSS